MTHQKALNMRKFFDGLFNQNSIKTYFVTIEKTYPNINSNDWSVFFYAKHKESSFLIELSALANALDSLCSNLHTRISMYDAGTTEPEQRIAVEIY